MKYILPTFLATPAIDLSRHAKGLLFRLHTITGWKLPDDDFFLNTLVSEFSRYLVEYCADLNPEEVSYAFRNFALETKDWGKSMNLQLIHDPISEYRDRRLQISQMEERLKSTGKTEEIEQPKEVDWSDKWEDVKSVMREEGLEGLNKMIIATSVYDWLVRTGKLILLPDDKRKIFQAAHKEYMLQLQTKINDKKGERLDYEDLAALRVDTWVQNPRLLSNAANISKVIATKELAICEIAAE